MTPQHSRSSLRWRPIQSIASLQTVGYRNQLRNWGHARRCQGACILYVLQYWLIDAVIGSRAVSHEEHEEFSKKLSKTWAVFLREFMRHGVNLE